MHPPNGTSENVRDLSGLYLVLLLLLGWLAYAHTLNVPFYFDDYDNIVENPAIHIHRLTPAAIHRAAFDSPMHNRPLAYLSFAANYYFGRYRVAGYHLVNIALHLGTGVLLFWLVRVTLALADPKARAHPAAALWIALIWLLHPLQTQAVTYIVQRMMVMAGFFYLLALCLYVAGRRTGDRAVRWCFWSGSAIAGVCALASKEVALTLPASIWLYEWFFFQEGRRCWLRRSLFPTAVVGLALAGLALVYTNFHPFKVIAGSYQNLDFSLCQRLLTQPRVILFYISLVLWPHPGRLALLHPIEVSRGWNAPPETLAAFLILAALVLVGFWLMRKDRIIAFALFWFLGNLIIESSVIGLEMVYEHRLYLPTLFVGLVLYRILDFCLGRWSNWPVLLIMAGFCWVLGFWTVDRNQVWTDPVAFWTQTVQRAPSSARARNNLAGAMMRRQQFAPAVGELMASLALDAEQVAAYLNLAEAYRQMNNSQAALNAYHRALALAPGSADILGRMAGVYLQDGRYDTAEGLLRQAIQDRPDNARLNYLLARVDVARGRLEAARRRLERTVAMDPGLAEAYDQLGQVRHAQGDGRGAVAAFAEAVRLDPKNPDFQFNLAYARETIGQDAEAAKGYRQVLDLRPGDDAARQRAVWLFSKMPGRTGSDSSVKIRARAAIPAAAPAGTGTLPKNHNAPERVP